MLPYNKVTENGLRVDYLADLSWSWSGSGHNGKINGVRQYDASNIPNSDKLTTSNFWYNVTSTSIGLSGTWISGYFDFSHSYNPSTRIYSLNFTCGNTRNNDVGVKDGGASFKCYLYLIRENVNL